MWPSPTCFSSSVSFHSSHWHFNHLLIFSSRYNVVYCGCRIPFLLLAICFPPLYSKPCFSITASLRSAGRSSFVPHQVPYIQFYYFSISLNPSLTGLWGPWGLKSYLCLAVPNTQETLSQCLYFCTSQGEVVKEVWSLACTEAYAVFLWGCQILHRNAGGLLEVCLWSSKLGG